MTALASWLSTLGERLRQRRWRGVLWIAADPELALERATAVLAAGPWRSPLWLGPAPAALPDDVARLAMSRARSRLGSEHDLVVFDAASADSGFDPDAFGAISGTVTAGGWLVLLTPADWGDSADRGCLPDADYRRLAHWPHALDTLSARYLARASRCLNRTAALARWPAASALPETPLLESSSFTAPNPALSSLAAPNPALSSLAAPDSAPSSLAAPDPAPPSLETPDCVTPDQAEAVARLCRLRRRRPLVLVADRGRGKSAALGIAAARRLRQGETRLWVSAPSEAAVAPLFARLEALLPQGRRTRDGFEVIFGNDRDNAPDNDPVNGRDDGPGHGRDDGRRCRVEWLAPEQVMARLREADIDPRSPPTLFVDEAAAIPAARLVTWLRAFPRLAFATTVHGYEGTGRGFEVRLREWLDRLTPDWRRLTLSDPVRFAADDPLERLTRDLLCLDAEPVTPATGPAPGDEHDALVYTWLDRDALAADDRLLEAAFGLLVQAHYRTAPSDLRQLLDGPDVRLLAACQGTVPVALCAIQREGDFDDALADAVYHGQRRPRGHLLAQSLATHGGYRDATVARWWRIMRIAVHPAWRRRGIGAALVEQAATAALAAGIERLGVSFGAEPTLMRFWRHQGFQSLRVGLTRDAASGEPALMMGRGLTPAATAAMHGMNADFARLLPDLLGGELQDIEPWVAACWLHEGEQPVRDATLRERLAWFASGGGELALVRPWLRTAWLAWWRAQPLTALPDALRDDTAVANGGEPPMLEAPYNLEALVAALYQHDDSRLSAGGKRERQAQARRLAATLLAWLDAAGEDMVKPQPDA
ncbi:tRNA(Met) cytidine acetyltransferase TmcA [Salinicola avicenniae]|uniref:tRNA(Met) cytidine acetyltransferase TmcA n=1 Tax=Salinicola avicenniae TaxID=2916836 RepID=UPI0020741A0E|nr:MULTISPECIES: GNAT family N-acetyltransferase [unclassified Salinicola]